MKWKWVYNLTGICFLVVGCMSQPERFREKKLVIPAKQTIHFKELGMSITNGGCGRKWMVEDGKAAGEKPFCDLTVKTKDSTWHFGDSFDPLYIKNLKLVIDKMNPWGKEEDSVPPGSCRIIVTRLDDLSR